MHTPHSHFSDALGAGFGATFCLRGKVEPCTVRLATFTSCLCVKHLTRFTKRRLLTSQINFFRLGDHLHLLFMCFKQLGLEGSSYLTGWFKEVATSLEGKSHETKILLLSKKITSFTSQNKPLMKTLECWVCKQPRILRSIALLLFLFWCFKEKLILFLLYLFISLGDLQHFYTQGVVNTPRLVLISGVLAGIRTCSTSVIFSGWSTR